MVVADDTPAKQRHFRGWMRVGSSVVAPVQCSVWLYGAFRRLRKVRRDAIADLLSQTRVPVRVHAFGNENSVSKGIDFDRWLTLKATLIGRW